MLWEWLRVFYSCIHSKNKTIENSKNFQGIRKFEKFPKPKKKLLFSGYSKILTEFSKPLYSFIYRIYMKYFIIMLKYI